ncbi:MAG: FIG00800187: hypothetical protein [uncultured Nocardioidaceae bacterium]|uniref:2'-5' RNA ligase family protein n=1 Tax=uncultured Nocardioidaceae bacterium TaxID=253824 RepID=A0A6J4MKN3_9ACTN|nr:MAG: FIG00800187: hypothetical protein [uncultured Nocardioidaceae bacterium]
MAPPPNPPADDRPLVISLRLDAAAQARFERERAELFPPGRTQVGAHLTLFHAVPGAQYDAVVGTLAEVIRRPPLALRVTGLKLLGRGVAYALESPELRQLHASWQRQWMAHLTRQDRQPLQPHVTVQNKVAPETARATLARLQAGFIPLEVRGTAVELWRYDGGPWTPIEDFGFRG